MTKGSAAMAKVLTAAVLTGLGLLLVARDRNPAPPAAAATPNSPASNTQPRSAGPQDAIYAMFDAARAGDVDGYTRWYGGAMAAALAQSAAEQGGRDGFARYLAESHAAVKGLAVEGARMTGDGQATVRVEYVYANRNEAQELGLERGAQGDWRIVRVERMQRVKTAVPYGSPAQ